MRTRLYFPGALVLLATLCATAVAEPPRTFAFQGVLTTPSGAYVADGSYSLTFRLYADLTGGSALWTESKSVTTSRGRFTTALGDTTSFPSSIHWGDDDYFVSIQVGTDAEATPRVPLIGVPYALGLPGVTVATGGNVGIGTTSPGHKLDVNGDINASGCLREMGIPLPSRYAFINGTNATGTWPINIGGSAPAGSLSGIVPIAKGGTGTSSSPTAAGEYLRSTGAGVWAPGTIPASDIPNLSATYMDLTTNQTAAGVKVFSDKVGIRNTSPTYALDVSGVIRTSSGLIFGDGTIQLSAGWHTNGNSGTNPGPNFLGTTDNKALELKVNSARALRIEPAASPNLIGGFSGNAAIPPAVQGAVVSGGGSVGSPNIVSDDYGTVGGGTGNTAGNTDGNAGNAPNTTVAGGDANKAFDAFTTVGGGQSNTAGDTANPGVGSHQTVAGGWTNTAAGSKSTIGGGQFNTALPAATYSVVAGGAQNQTGGSWAAVGGGQANVASGQHATVPGGASNTAAGSYSLAAGRQAAAQHQGAFVWADSSGVPFVSTGVDQFLIRAAGGVGINTNAPIAGVTLDVNGMVYSRAGGYMFPDGSVQATAAGAALPAWRLAGNAGTIFGTHFVGTTDGAALDVRVSNTSAMQFWPTAGTPNIRGGWSGNVALLPAQGIFLGGGGFQGVPNPHPNAVYDDFGVLGGGADNTVGANDGNASKQAYATIGGGQANTASAGWASILGGDHNTASNLYATATGGAQNVAAGSGATVGGGMINLAPGTESTIAGGRENQAQGLQSFVGGGGMNVAAGQQSTVGGGDTNIATGLQATIGGGWMNKAVDPNTTVGGGQTNVAGNPAAIGSGNHATVGGGVGNQATGAWSTIPGGNQNIASGNNSFAAGNQAGALHNGAWVWADSPAGPAVPFNSTGANQFLIRASGNVGINTNAPTSMLDVNGQIRTRVGGIMFPDGTVQLTAAGAGTPGWSLTGNAGTVPGTNFLGTTDNRPLEIRVNNTHAMRMRPTAGTPDIIGGFSGNSILAAAQGAGIASGGVLNSPNTVNEDYGFIGGGSGNSVDDGDGNPTTSSNAVVAGGNANRAPSQYAAVGGGQFNTAGGPWSAVPGGQENIAGGPHSAVGGGLLNQALGPFAVIPGGLQNQAPGPHSLAAGSLAIASLPGCFVWADSTGVAAGIPFLSAIPNEFAAQASGGVRFISTPSGAPPVGVQLPPGAGAWITISDRGAKENFAAVDPVEVVRRLAAIPIETWNYKSQDGSIRHMGPMAQDFREAFGIGEDEKHISTIDADGVALAAAQGLYMLLQEKEARIAALEAKNADLERRLSALEARFGPK